MEGEAIDERAAPAIAGEVAPAFASAIGEVSGATSTLASPMLMTALGGGGGSSGGTGGSGETNTSSGSPSPGEEPQVCEAEDSNGDLASVDPGGDPFTDPLLRSYANPQSPVVDHVEARAMGGHPTDPANLDIKTLEANARKGGFEGNYLRDLRSYKE